MKHKKIYEDGKYVPQRMCIACRQVRPKGQMIRVSSSDGIVVLDLDGKKQGRGYYVCNTVECIEKAHRVRGLERGLKTAIPVEIYEECLNLDK